MGPSPYLGVPGQTVDLFEFLRLDSRPTVILDVEKFRKNNIASAQEIYDSIIFKNEAYEVLGPDEDFSVLSNQHWRGTSSNTWSGSRLRWTSTPVSNDRYRVITGASIVAIDEDVSRDFSKVVDFTSKMPADAFARVAVERRLSFSQPGLMKVSMEDQPQSLDWTEKKVPIGFSMEMRLHHKLLHSVQWARTSLGPINKWSPEIRVLANYVMNSPFPTCLFYGSEFLCIHNAEFATSIGLVQNPAQMGLPLSKGYEDLTDHVYQWVDAAYSGIPFQINNVPMTLERELTLEETYHNWSATPVVLEGLVGGVLVQTLETTGKQLFRRRLLTLQALGRASAVSNDENDFALLVAEALDSNPFDAPFIALYKVANGTNECTLKLTRRLNPEQSVLPTKFVPSRKRAQGFEDDIRRVILMKTRLQIRRNLVSDGMLKGVEDNDYDVRCNICVTIPVLNEDEDRVSMVIILGANPRRPFDNDYMLWAEALKRQLSSSMTAVSLHHFPMEKKDDEDADLDLDVANRSHPLGDHLRDAELEFIHIAESMVIGVKLIDKEGNVTYANKAWHDATMMPQTDKLETWPGHIHKADREGVVSGFIKAVMEGSPFEAEFRCVEFVDGVYDEKETNFKWCRVDMNVILNQRTKERIGFYATMVDISEIKAAEARERSLKEVAIEMKVQQEAFIDVTSHELRNPLSAILQSAEAIIEELDEESVDLDSIDESCQTILLCVGFQKRIVDDILVLSKLDSELLTVSPTEIEIHEVVSTGLSMFQSEFEARDIKAAYEIEDSYRDLNVQWVVADPARFTQVLVNLLTNAIKFTAPQKKREITVYLGASETPPKQHRQSIYLSKDAIPKDTRDHKAAKVASNLKLGQGKPIYVMITVQDSGIGISENEAKVLFQRFYQVPKTHVHYGGSGLGLFISRKLAQLHDGEIGVHSEEGVGSAFSYYIKAARGMRPDHETATGPAGFSSKRKMRLTAEASSPSAKKEPSPSKKSLGLSVLIVEDNLVNQRVLQKQFISLDCQTFLANNGVESLDVLSRSKYSIYSQDDAFDIDVVLMDCEMPLMDGLEATIIIREREASGEFKNHVPILGVSANARSGQIDEMMQAGMDDVLSKPFRNIDLQNKVVALASTQKKLQT